MSQRSVVIVSGVRTAIGDYGGALKDIPPTELGAKVVHEAIARAKVDPAEVGQCVIGNVIHTEAKDMYVSRVVGMKGGLPASTGALTVNRLCGSGLQAIVSASQYILLGDTDVAVGGGCESMSRGGYLDPAQRWGARMGDAKVIDMMVGALTDPVRHHPHGDHRGERRDQVRPHARRPGPLRGREPPPRRTRRPAPGTSRARSCRSSSRARRARPSSIPTSTSAPTPRSRAWASCAPRS